MEQARKKIETTIGRPRMNEVTAKLRQLGLSPKQIAWVLNIPETAVSRRAKTYSNAPIDHWFRQVLEKHGELMTALRNKWPISHLWITWIALTCFTRVTENNT